MAGTSAPLLNEYKQEFFWRRLPQTILGGLRLNLSHEAPCYVYTLQLVLFAFPFVVAGSLTLVREKTDAGDLAVALATGFIVGIATLLLRLFVRHRSAKSTTVTQLNTTNNSNLLDDDNYVDFQSVFSIETLTFLVVPRRYLFNAIFHSVVSGATIAGALVYLLPSRLDEHFSIVGVVFVFGIGWLTVCIANYGLVFATPPEPATYTTTQDRFELASLTRPLHVAFFLVFDFSARFCPELVSANKWLYVVFCCLPFLWTIGVLPPLNALLPWAGEQALVLGLGGSPMASTLRLALMLVGSGAVLVAVTYVPVRVGLVLSACFGLLLSLDLSSPSRQLAALCFSSTDQSRSLCKWGVKELAFCATGICVTGVLTGLLHWKSESISDTVPDILTYVLIGCYILAWVLGSLQSVYLTGNLLRNPIYPQDLDETTFKAKRNRLRKAAYVRRILFISVMPLLGVAILALLLDEEDVTIAAFIFALGSVRSLRWVWQDTSSSVLEIIVVQIIRWSLASSWWTGLGFGIQLLLVSVLHTALRMTLLKLTYIATLSITSWTLKKQRHRLVPCILFTALLFLPITIVLVLLSSFISAPILPLFCVPFFALAFPRPRHFWPSPVGTAYSPCADSVFYRQLSPQIQVALKTLFASGSLGNPSPGEHFLFRYQDRFAWICITERGLGYVTVYIKGLELQETSCHTAEATQVDELFENAFERKHWLNTHPLNTLHPKDKIFIKTYSDARNVLTGIIDHPDNLNRLPGYFLKSLAWVVMHYLASLPSPPSVASGGGGGGGGSKFHQESSPRRKISMRKEKEKTTSQSIRIHSQVNKNEFKKKISILTVETIYSLSSETPSTENQSEATWNSMFTTGSSFPGSTSKTQPTQPDSRANFFPGSPSTFGGFPQTNRASSFSDDVDVVEGAESDDLAEALRLTGLIESPKQRKSGAAVPVLPFPGQASTWKGKRSSVTEPSRGCGGLTLTLEQSSYLPLPPGWLDLPIDERILADLMADFPHDWLVYVQALLHKKGRELAASESQTHVKFLLACYAMVQGLTQSSRQFLGPSQVFLNYRGDFPWSPNLPWITQDKCLLSLMKKAYRYAVKMMCDSVILGEPSSDEEVVALLEEFDRDWYIGDEEEESWHTAVLQEKPRLFSLGYNKIECTYTGRVLSLQSLPVHVGQLNSEAVHGQWASLALELIYFTNDDEERYSIQAHPTLLRNLTIQAADPPLGYPIYASGPVSVPTW